MGFRMTSKNAYENIGKIISGQKEKIIEHLSKRKVPLTRGEIAKELDFEKSSTSARVNELLKEGCLREAGKRQDLYSGITSYTVEIDNREQKRFF